MKKILLGAMIASVALAASAAEVTSDNVVGYTRINLEGGKMNCVALQFQDVGSTTAAATIAKLTSTGLTAGVYDTMETDAPCIMFYNGLGYDYYYYISVVGRQGSAINIIISCFTGEILASNCNIIR
jgi:opacity protein-like surface antigen